MADNKELPGLPVLAYGVELPSGKFSRIRVGLDDARRYVDEWNFDHPKPPLAKLTALTSLPAATAALSELRAEVERLSAMLDHRNDEAAETERMLRAEMQQQALRSLTSEGEWIEMTGKLRAEVEAAQKLAADRLEQMQADRAQALVWRDEVERRGDVIRGHEATLTRLQGDLLRAGLKLEASRLECERLRVDAERYQWLRSGTRVRGSAELEGGARIIDKSKLYALMSFNFWCKPEELDAAIDTARSAASGESAEGVV